jgi:hypothetical protein
MIGPWPEIRSGMLSFNSLTESVSVAPRVDCRTTKVAIAACEDLFRTPFAQLFRACIERIDSGK